MTLMLDSPVTMRTAASNCLANFAMFSGRASRAEFGWWLAALTVATAVHLAFDALVSAPLLGFPMFSPDAGRPLTVIGSAVLTIPTLAVAARRLHDTGRSGAWLWLLLAPGVGLLALGWLLTRPSAPRDNRHGPYAGALRAD